MENNYQNTNQIFIASKNSYGESSVTYKGLELVVYNPLDRGSNLSFSWGNTNAGSEALAYAILNKVSSRDLAYRYSKTYMQKVIAKIQKDDWTLERIEVMRWINENTNFSIDENSNEDSVFTYEERRQEDRRKEERRVQREKDFQEEIQKKLKIYEEKNRLKELIVSKNSDIEALKIELKKYKLFIESLDIKSMYEKYTHLDV